MPRKSLVQRAQENATKLRIHLLSFTCKLVRMSREKKITGIASGFLVKRDGKWRLLSAAHALRRGKWFLETEVVLHHHRETVVLPIRDIMTWETKSLIIDSDDPKERRIDFAVGRIDHQLLHEQIRRDPLLANEAFTFQFYEGPLNSLPVKNVEPYSYASWNRALLIKGPWVVLERSASYEMGMVFTGLSKDRKYYCFKPNSGHKGHRYYKGASGSPITDAEGRIVSMLLGGHKRKNALYGLRLAKFSGLLKML
jgi:hypothetical protein